MGLNMANKLFQLQMGFLHNNQLNIEKHNYFLVIYMDQNSQYNLKQYLSKSYSLSYNLYKFLNRVAFLEDNFNNISYYKEDKQVSQLYTRSNKSRNCKLYNIGDSLYKLHYIDKFLVSNQLRKIDNRMIKFQQSM